MRAFLPTVVLLCGGWPQFAASAIAQAPSRPSASWTFDGTAAGLTPMGGVMRFADDSEIPATDGNALALGSSLNSAAYLTTPMTDATRLGADYTIEAWIYPTRINTWNRLVMNWGASRQYAYHLALHEGNANLIHCQSNGKYIACEGGLVQTDRWQHLAGVADSARKSLSLYLDGQLVATMSFDGTAATTTTEAFAIGDSAGLSDPGLSFTGYLDSVTLWKQPLSESQIAARFATHAQSPPVASLPGEIVFSERHPGRDPSNHFYANFGYACTNENEWLHGADGGRLAILDPATGQARTLLADPDGAMRDPQVHYDAKKVLFSYRKGGTHHYNLFEINLDGTGLKQLTSGDWDDIEPVYLPDGGIVFCSTRCKRYILCWIAPAATLHRCNADGSNIRRLSSGVATETTPAILPDGRILFTRWEYVNRASTQFKQLWTMNPDGSGVMTYYGNMHPNGCEFIDARPIPGNGKVVYINGGHCTNEHAGAMMLLELNNGPDDLSSVKPILGGNNRDPFPIASGAFLAARGNEIILVDDQGKAQRIYRTGMMVHEPRLIAQHPREAVIPSHLNPEKATGSLFLTDVNIGRNMAGLKPGTIRKLLVMEQLPKPVNYHGGGTTPIAHGGKWTLNRILGTVPVEADGSANFEVPAGRSIYLAALDENDLSVKQMRSFLTVMPGEHASCIGCHENRTMTPPVTRPTLAANRAPDQIQPIPGVPEIIDFPRDIQPILDRHCVDCHHPASRGGGVVLTGDRGPTYSLAYYNLMLHRQIKDTAGAGWTKTRNAGGEPVGNDSPYEAFSSASPLMKLLDGSHYRADLTADERTIVRLWLDSATPYAGTYAAYGTGQIGGWWRNNEPIREMSEAWPSTAPARDAMTRRCATCHENRMPTYVTDHQVATVGGYYDFEGFQRPASRFSRHYIFNLTHPEQSLALIATLAKSAGGEAAGALPPAKPVPPDWGDAPQPIVHPIVFATTADPDYQRILAHLQAATIRLDEIKRFDMPGFRPRYEYLREMKRYGVLPADFDPAVDTCDPYATDRRYWESLANDLQPTPNIP
jgi:cytochrome c553